VVDPTDDSALATRVAAGDEAALETLYARHAGPLYAFVCHHVSRSRTDAEEIWQDTLLAAIRSLPKYDGRGRLFTWLCGIARHKIADHFRRCGSSPAAFSELSAEQLRLIIDKSPLPEEMLSQPEVRIKVIETLAALPEPFRVALSARYAEERSVEDVAGILGKTYKGAESLLSRARAAFRAAFLGQDVECCDE
jgi:RNA polymerase sigma factor (sigma-70 family)